MLTQSAKSVTAFRSIIVIASRAFAAWRSKDRAARDKHRI
jgi:hypothetical protein